MLKRLSAEKRRIRLFGIVLLFLCLVAIRGIHLRADPPSKLSWSGGLYGDEPAYAHNARNKAVFGKWVLDEWNPYLYNPILTLFDYVSFEIFGTGFFALRMVALFWGILTLFFVYDTLRRNFEEHPWLPLFGLLLLEVNYPFLMYTRLSLSDTMLTNWMLLTLFLWSLGQKYGVARFFSGMAAIAVFSCKPTAIYFTLVVGASYLFSFFRDNEEGRSLRRALDYFAPFLVGLGLGMVVWFFFYYRPFHAEIAHYSRQWSQLSMPRNIDDFINHVFGVYAPIVFQYYVWFPFILLVGWLYFPISAYRFVRNWRVMKSFELFSLLWAVIGYFSLSGFRYRPARYFVSLIPPVIFLAVCGFLWVIGLGEDEWHLSRNKAFIVIYLGWVGMTFHLIKRYLIFSKVDLVFTVGVILGLFVISLILKKKMGPGVAIRPYISYCIVVGIFTLSVGHNFSYYLKWVRNLTFQEVAVSKNIGTFIRGETIAGLWAPMVCMENDNKALCIAPGWFNDRRPYERYHFKYVFLWEGNRKAEYSMVIRVFGKSFFEKRLKPVAKYLIKDAWAYLYKVVPGEK